MQAIIEKVLGTSWKTTMLGWAQGIMTGVFSYLIGQLTNNEPIMWAGISASALRVIAGYLAKDYNVTGGTKNETPKQD